MSTKLQSIQFASWADSLTYQARSIVDDAHKAVIGATAHADPMVTTAWAKSESSTRHAVYAQCTRSAEANRQVGRVRNLLALEIGDEDRRAKLIESVGTSVALLHSFVSSPAPIPVASDGDDEGTSLFIESDKFYGDIEISGHTIEYYIRSKNGDDEIEHYDIEEVENGMIPSRLLGCLYSHYAM